MRTTEQHEPGDTGTAPEMSAFTHRLEQLTAEDIERLAETIRADLDSVDGEVAWWRATIAVSGALRRHHKTRQASMAAHRAACAVVDAARQAGLGEDRRDEVTQVARAAAEVARVLVAGDSDVATAVREPLLHAWQDVVAGGPAAAAAA